EIFNDESAFHVAWNTVKVYGKILFRHIIGHTTGKVFHRLFHDDDRHPLSGTTVVRVIVSTALRYEIKRAAVPVPETLRIEIIRVFKYVLAVHRPIYIESNHCILFNWMPFELYIRFCFGRQERNERIEPSYFLGEHVCIVIIGLDLLPRNRMLMHRKETE